MYNWNFSPAHAGGRQVKILSRPTGRGPLASVKSYHQEALSGGHWVALPPTRTQVLGFCALEPQTRVYTPFLLRVLGQPHAPTRKMLFYASEKSYSQLYDQVSIPGSNVLRWDSERETESLVWCVAGFKSGVQHHQSYLGGSSLKVTSRCFVTHGKWKRKCHHPLWIFQ